MARTACLLLLMGAAAGLWACDDDEPAGPSMTIPANRGLKGESCQARNDCSDGLACVRNICVVDEFPISPSAKGCDIIECNAVADCVRLADGCEDLQTRCADGEMEACQGFEQNCNFVCEANRCESRCTDDADCGGGNCRDGVCVQCAANEDCADDERCVRGQCIEPCRDDLACPLFHGCVDGECVDTGCQSDRACIALLRNVEARCLEGACTEPCDTDADCDEPDEYDFLKCVGGLCQHVGCDGDDECRARLFGEGPIEGNVLDVVCREGGTLTGD